jgi:hypothetical protein
MLCGKRFREGHTARTSPPPALETPGNSDSRLQAGSTHQRSSRVPSRSKTSLSHQFGSPAPLVGGFRAFCQHFPGGGERRAGTGGARWGTPSSDSTPLLVPVLGDVLPSKPAWGTRPEASTPAHGPWRAIRPLSSGIRAYAAHPAPGSPTKGAGEPHLRLCLASDRHSSLVAPDSSSL